ncbi:hypothetical protein [Tepidimicrobium xylanilyticum]|uniref:Uncharacterized protein n=1 Tax=Tepidimicrobium xylanilyticum TaxID=1123352 RepID=A0A1H2SUN2_9FIRM|nr:hypothetical protein [Tepidimicrobium xylanilyticum]GMG96109.1 hypothetical protein EN5CB1_09350 [Tepidimicrobium xylanilyticum]SDW35361.1 hypothetical protein SAMN05660923_00551 [Tepidimicrobium xylanilyticum]
MENKVKVHKNKKKLLIVFLIVLFTTVYLIWYGELRTNREVPKRAKLVINLLMRGDSYQ